MSPGEVAAAIVRGDEGWQLALDVYDGGGCQAAAMVLNDYSGRGAARARHILDDLTPDVALAELEATIVRCGQCYAARSCCVHRTAEEAAANRNRGFLGIETCNWMHTWANDPPRHEFAPLVPA